MVPAVRITFLVFLAIRAMFVCVHMRSTSNHRRICTPAGLYEDPGCAPNRMQYNTYTTHRWLVSLRSENIGLRAWTICGLLHFSITSLSHGGSLSEMGLYRLVAFYLPNELVVTSFVCTSRTARRLIARHAHIYPLVPN